MGILTEEQIASIRAKHSRKSRRSPKTASSSPYKPQKSVMDAVDYGVTIGHHQDRGFGQKRIKQVGFADDDRVTYVYFLQSEDTKAIKIGVTHNLGHRLKSLQTGSASRLYYLGTIMFSEENRALWIEQALHDHFSSLRRKGEWFSPGDDLLSFIKTYLKDNEDLTTFLKQSLEKISVG